MTTEYCKDCKAEHEAYETWVFRTCCDWQSDGCPKCLPKPPVGPATTRPAPHPGPRCTTHWRRRKQEVKAANHEKRVQNTYGLKKGEYAKLYLFQGGLCALCRRATGASRRLSVDHDHKTGDVRGLLCRPCNSLLGHARDQFAFFRRCIRYLAITPYSQMKNGAPAYGEDPPDEVSDVCEASDSDEGREVP